VYVQLMMDLQFQGLMLRLQKGGCFVAVWRVKGIWDSLLPAAAAALQLVR
jgi:hypothetical protein